MLEKQCYRTADIAPGARLAYWNEVAAGPVGAASIDAAESESFRGALTFVTSDRLQLASIKSTAASVQRASTRVQALSDDRRFALKLVHTGRCLVRRHGHEYVATAGDIIFSDAAGPAECSNREPLHIVGMRLPWDRFSVDAEKLEAMVWRRIPADHGPAAVLSTFMRSTWDNLVEPGRGQWPASTAELLWDLVSCVLNVEDGPKLATDQAERLCARAKAYISTRLCDPELEVPQIAEALGVSVRYLQMVFADAGTTPSRFILAQRLDRAAARLRHEGKACCITELALDCGFNELSYFSTTFNQRFGVSARDYRRSYGGGLKELV